MDYRERGPTVLRAVTIGSDPKAGIVSLLEYTNGIIARGERPVLPGQGTGMIESWLEIEKRLGEGFLIAKGMQPEEYNRQYHEYLDGRADLRLNRSPLQEVFEQRIRRDELEQGVRKE